MCDIAIQHLYSNNWVIYILDILVQNSLFIFALPT